jgi:hypothetical protein
VNDFDEWNPDQMNDPAVLGCEIKLQRFEVAMDERVVAQFGDIKAHGPTPAIAVRRFDEVWEHGKHLS